LKEPHRRIVRAGRREADKDEILAKVRKRPALLRMAKVTSKYQVTLPRKVADEYQIRPGDDIAWVPAGDVIRVVPPARAAAPESREARLRLFDQATERHRKRLAGRTAPAPSDRGWKREDLYGRGRTR